MFLRTYFCYKTVKVRPCEFALRPTRRVSNLIDTGIIVDFVILSSTYDKYNLKMSNKPINKAIF